MTRNSEVWKKNQSCIDFKLVRAGKDGEFPSKLLEVKFLVISRFPSIEFPCCYEFYLHYMNILKGKVISME